MASHSEGLPLVSVLIPSYNHELYVVECLGSLLIDGYPRLEVVLLDDGSTDRTFDIASEWLRAHLSSFEKVSCERQRNAGICATLNRLIDKAKGDYLILLASDDFLLPGGVVARVQALEAQPSLLAVFGDCRVIDEKSRVTHESGIAGLFYGDRVALANAERIRFELLWNWCVPGPVLMARKHCFDEKVGVGRYDEGLLVEDRDFYLRLIAGNRVGFTNRAVSAYRVHSANTFSAPSLARRIALAQSMWKAADKNARHFHGLDKMALKLEAAMYSSSVRVLQDPENFYFRGFAFMVRKTKRALYKMIKGVSTLAMFRSL